MRKLMITNLVAALASGVACAESVYFTPSDGLASDPANWSTGALPTTADTICMTNINSNCMRIQSGDSLSASNFNICRNNNDGLSNRQVIRQTGGTVTTTGSSSLSSFAIWPRDTAEYYLSGGQLNLKNNELMIGGRGTGFLNIDGGSASFTISYPKICGWGGGQGALDVRGGSLTTSGDLSMAGYETGYGHLNIGGSGRVDVGVKLRVSWDSASTTGILNLMNGGTLSCAGIDNSKGAGSYFSLAGGTLTSGKAATVTPDFVLNANLYANAGGARIDTKDNRLSLAVPVNRGNLRKENLYRRWSFTNGSLVDSIAGVEAETVGGVTLANDRVSLPGGKAGTAFVRLQKEGALLPSDYDGGFTIEMWAQVDAVTQWPGVFRLYKSSSDNIYLRWNKAATDGSAFSEGGIWIGGSDNGSYVDGGVRGWTTGEMCYIAAVFTKNADGTWTLSFNRYHYRNGIRYQCNSKSTVSSSFDPTIFTDSADFSLGRSHGDQNDATATYDEVRIWKRPLSHGEMAASAAMGPDADFDDANGLEKTGSGLLALSGANGYAGTTTVAEGALSLGAQPAVLPYHRWSFNGDLKDTADIASTVACTAAKVGSNAASITLSETGVTLPGGEHETAYLRLVNDGSKLLDTAADGHTFEFWVRENAVTSWARIFQFAINDSYQHFMTWTCGTDTNLTYIATSASASTVNGKTSTALAKFEVGKWYHVAMTTWKTAEGAWRVTFSKHDPATGALLGSETVTPADGWSPAKLATRLTLGYSASYDADAAASYDEVRVWNRTFSEAELAYSARLGPDILPTFAATASSPASLAADTALVVSNGASFFLSGASQTVASLAGEGQIVGPGTLTVTGTVTPAADGSVGALRVSGGLKLVGTVHFDCLTDGTSDGLVFAPGETYDVSGVKLSVTNVETLPIQNWYRLVDTTGATLVGSFDVSALPSGLRVNVTADGVYVKAIRGLRFFIR